MRRACAAAAISSGALLLAGCTTLGTGTGEVAARAGEPAPTVHFSWRSTDGGITGTMSARVDDTHYLGRFFQVTEESRYDAWAPSWHAWHSRWWGWPYWGPPFPPHGPITEYVTHYSGKVLAELEGPEGAHMRCRFQLVRPSHGMSGGGQGSCRLPDGGKVAARFPAAT